MFFLATMNSRQSRDRKPHSPFAETGQSAMSITTHLKELNTNHLNYHLNSLLLSRTMLLANPENIKEKRRKYKNKLYSWHSKYNMQ